MIGHIGFKAHGGKGFDVIETEIQGNVSNCDLFNCKLMNSDIKECNLFNQTQIESCRISDSYSSRNALIKDSYVFGPLTIFSGEMEGGVFKEGKTTKFARFNNTEVIKTQKI